MVIPRFDRVIAGPAPAAPRVACFADLLFGPPVDPDATILYGTWGVLRDSTRVLLDFVPATISQEHVEVALRKLPGVQAIHELHLWSTGSRTILTAHLVPESGVDPNALLARAEHELRGHLGIHHTTIQIDPPAADSACEQQACPLLQEAPPGAHAHHHHHGHHH